MTRMTISTETETAATTNKRQAPFELNKVKKMKKEEFLKIVSWNVGGINACLKKGFLQKVEELSADILLLQETKLQKPSDFCPRSLYPFQYQSLSTEKKGYSGSALLSKIKPINVEYSVGLDSLKDEGRYIIAEFDEFILVCCYIPNAGSKLERLEIKRKHYKEALLPFLQGCLEKKPIIVAGDLNVAHTEKDLARPKGNEKTAGYTPGERQDFTEMMETLGLFDSYRVLHPEANDKFTYYSYRFNCYAKNLGWRLDYFLVSEALKDCIKKVDIHTTMHGSSDHVPLAMLLSTKEEVLH